jgi:hypothetical protein
LAAASAVSAGAVSADAVAADADSAAGARAAVDASGPCGDGHTADDVSLPWGWIQWLAHLPAPLWAGSVYLNSQGRGLHAAHRMLLGKRNLRLAPVGVLPTNVSFLALLLGNGDLVEDAAKLTADRWADPVASELFGFEPTIDDTLRWLDSHWFA